MGDIRLPMWAQKAEHVVAAGALIYVAKNCYSVRSCKGGCDLIAPNAWKEIALTGCFTPRSSI